MMGEKKAAICIPTYNRSEAVREFIETTAELYFRYGFDIYIYDSSENELTRDVVAEKTAQYNKLHYVRIASDIHSNMKVYNIFREFGDSREYDYLWVCSDSIRWSERALKAVCGCIAQGYDLIIPNYRDVEKLGDREYTDRNQLFLDCAWHMTLYGATILKVSAMLTEVDWEDLVCRYAVPECINHSHVAFYFEKLSRMEGWKAMHISLEEEDLHASAKKKHPGWLDETFYVWCHCWPAMIRKLPECYESKDKVIKKSGVNSTILSFINIRSLRMQEIYNMEIYRHYRGEWRHLTNVPVSVLYLLARIPADKIYLTNARWIYSRICRYMETRRMKVRLKRFCRRFDRIYIYGAGKKASRFTGYLEDWRIPFEGYLVSALSGNEETAGGRRVLPFSPKLLEGGHIGVVVALNEENTKQVMGGCLKGVHREIIFSEYE